MKTIGFIAAICCGAGSGWAQGPDNGQTPALAMVQTSGLDLGQLNHFFDAASLRLKQMANPKTAPTTTKSAPVPKRSHWRKAVMKQADFTPKWPSRSKITMPVPTPAAYRRTFRRLMDQPETTDRYDELILKYAQAYHLDARLLKAVIAAESEFFRGAISPKGAKGLMQVMPATAQEMGIAPANLHDPNDNIRAGAAYLARLFSAAWLKFKLKGVRFQDAPLWLKERIIAAYNAGPRFLFGRSPWYTQTRHYVKKVILFYHSPVTDFRRAPKALNAYPPISFSLSPVTLY